MVATKTTRTCCFCVPVRVGMVLLAPITLLLSTTLAGAIIFHLWSNASRLPKSTRAIGGVYTALMLILAIASFLGLVGSAAKIANLVRIFSWTLLTAWILGVILGTSYIANAFMHKRDIIGSCKYRQERLWAGNEPLIELGQEACAFKFRLWAGVFITLWIIFHAVFLYFVVVASRASRVIHEEDEVLRNTYAYPGGAAAAGGGSSGGGGSRPSTSTGRTAADISNSTLPVIQTPRTSARTKRRGGIQDEQGEKTPKAMGGTSHLHLHLQGGAPSATSSSTRDKEKSTPPSGTRTSSTTPPTPGGHGPSSPWQARFPPRTPLATASVEGNGWGGTPLPNTGNGGNGNGNSTHAGNGGGSGSGSGGGGGSEPGTRSHGLSHSSSWTGYSASGGADTPSAPSARPRSDDATRPSSDLSNPRQ